MINFENPDTNYQNGIDSHLDLAASQFVSEKMHIGLVGYLYYQLSGDSGSGAILGDFQGQVIGLGPQLGYFFNMGGVYQAGKPSCNNGVYKYKG